MTMEAKRIELMPAKDVLFDAEKHEYWKNGKQLSGITSVLHRMLFPNEFDGIPMRVVAAAADYGHSVHSSIEAFDMLYENDGSIEVQDYADICLQYGLAHAASELLVSDGENYASSIDKVYRVDDSTFSIGDIKTYYGKLRGEKREKCRWQLSIYAAFLEQQVPGAKIEKIFVLHIRNKPKKDGTFDHISELVYLDRIPAEVCRQLLEADRTGQPFVNPYVGEA